MKKFHFRKSKKPHLSVSETEAAANLSFPNQIQLFIFYTLLIFGLFGLFFNLSKADLNQQLIPAVVDTILLGWSSLISYPFLIYVAVMENTRKQNYWNQSAMDWWKLFFATPMAILIFHLAFKFVNLIWSS